MFPRFSTFVYTSHNHVLKTDLNRSESLQLSAVKGICFRHDFINLDCPRTDSQRWETAKPSLIINIFASIKIALFTSKGCFVQIKFLEQYWLSNRFSLMCRKLHEDILNTNYTKRAEIKKPIKECWNIYFF